MGSGNGTLTVSAGCAHCDIPNEVARLGLKVLVVERDSGNTAAALRETAARLDAAVTLLGQGLGRLEALTAKVEQAILARLTRKRRKRVRQ